VEHLTASFCKRDKSISNPKALEEERSLKEREESLIYHRDQQTIKRIHERKKSSEKEIQVSAPFMSTEQKGHPIAKSKEVEVKRPPNTETKMK
jgi:hypothetical protein